MWFFTHRNDDRPAMKLLPLQVTKYDRPFSQSMVCYIPLHCFTLAIIVLRYLPEKSPHLAADLSQQFGGDATDRQP